MKLLGYARTTWAEQVQGGFASVQEQEQRLRAFAEQAGVDLGKVYSDTGISPTQGTCAGLISILDAMEEPWDGVLVVAPCRIRDMDTLSFDALAELKQNGKAVLVADDETAEALAERKKKVPPKPKPPRREDERARRRKIAERLFKGREAGAKAGKHQSGPAPFGYRRDYSQRATEGVLLVPDPEEAEIVKMIFREYLRLRSMKRLIKLLDEKGLRTRRGKRWSRAGVSWILKNDTYVGRVHFGEIRAKGRHEPIVPPILFNKVQKLIRANNKRNRKQIRKEDAEAVLRNKDKKPAKRPARCATSSAVARRKSQRVVASSGSGVA
ncbi:MAG: recombinase family protein [Planctomycetota bacterium]|nr:MAG: recombinase family protein [Planctomycetota bacterium]